MPHYYLFISRLFLVVGLFYVTTSDILAQCTGTQATVVITVVEDYWADQETSWALRDQNNALLGSGTPEGTTICVPSTACLTFTMIDTYGDGLDGGSQSADGSYLVTYNGTTVASGAGNFGSQVTAQFGTCPTGGSCSFPTVINEGTYSAPNPNTWYQFTPDSTGQYIVDACANTCNTVIWIYNTCNGLTPTEDQEGTYAFSSAGCGNQAYLSLNLEANITYYIRIGDEGTSCAAVPIAWSLTYNGPIVGCMNPTACNYEPLATVSDPSACIFPGDPSCPNGPDLTVLQSVLVSSIYYQTRNNTSNCYVSEGCMNGYGTREIIRFTTHIKNIGNQDYFIGAPSTDPSQFEWDACHSHWHYEGYAEYLLYDANGVAIPIGFKNGFCVLDLECSDGGIGKFTCGNMGITAQCGDIYDSGLNCQWVDITAVPAGTYTLVVRVNWDNSPDKLGRYETDMSNNWAQACVQITRNGTTAINVVNTCTPYIDCAGQIYGSATVDCNGNCMGLTKAGDLNTDATYTLADETAYMTAITQHNLTKTNCNDLNDDDTLTITDPILLNSCMNQIAGIHVDADNHCELPTYNVHNPNDTSSFRIISYDPISQYVDVYLKSPMTNLLGYQFRVQGIDIISIESLLPNNYDMLTSFNSTTGDVAAFSSNESQIPRYITYQPILRIYYAIPIPMGTNVCLSMFTTVNQNHEETTGITPNCFVPYLNAKATVWLQGAFNGVAGNMNTTLNTSDLVPLQQPFNRVPWLYTGTETVTDLPTNAVDWVLIELRDATATTIVERRAALLLQNGEVRDVQGNEGANFYLANPNTHYKLIIRARNHLAILSATTIQLPAAVPYDCSLPANVLGGQQMMQPLFIDPTNVTHYGLMAGDINANGVITVTDVNKFSLQTSHINVYEEGDCNMDGNVTVGDFNFLNSNISAIGVLEVRY